MGPLAGLRVLEFEGLGPVPFAAMMLADMGADVLRIDRKGSAPPVPDPITGRGRPRVAADLKDPAQRDIVATLAGRADVLIEGFRPGVMERLGLGPDRLLAANPRLVFGRMTGWGQTGPLSQQAGHDINYIAPTGALAAIGPADRPVPPLNLVGDFGGGAMFLLTGVLAAVLSARSTGIGQVVDCAMSEGALALMAPIAEMAADGQWQFGRRAHNMLDGGAPYYTTYRCADGLDLAVGAIEPEFFAALAEVLDLPPALLATRDDPASWPALHAAMAASFARHPRAHWLDRTAARDACLTEILTFDAAPGHHQLGSRQAFIEVDGLCQPAPAPRFSATPSQVRPEGRRILSLSEAARHWAPAAADDPSIVV